MKIETAIPLIKSTFIDDLHNSSRDHKKMGFAHYKEVDSIKQNGIKLQRIDEEKRSIEEFTVFNYLWHHFPKFMETKDEDPKLLRCEIGDWEFNKILRAAKKFYTFRTCLSFIPLAVNIMILIFTFINRRFDIVFDIFVLFFIFSPASIPLCFLGGYIGIDQELKYKIEKKYRSSYSF